MIAGLASQLKRGNCIYYNNLTLKKLIINRVLFNGKYVVKHKN